MEDWSRQFERLCRERIAEERAPDSAFADLQPVLLFLDPARFGAELTTVPALIRQRFQARPLRQVLSLSPDDPELDPFMDPWQRRQFRELGYALTVLVHLPLQHIPRGRRALAPVELALREAFNYPPFIRLVRATLKNKDPKALCAQAAHLKSIFKQRAQEILGPVPCGKKTDTLKKEYLLFKLTDEQYFPAVEVLDSLSTQNKKQPLKLSADPYDFY